MSFNEMDFTINSLPGKSISSMHDGGAYVGFANGHTKYLQDTVSPDVVRAMLTRNGGETVKDSDY